MRDYDYSTMTWFDAHQMLNRACNHLRQAWVVGNKENVDARNALIGAMVLNQESHKEVA